MIAKLNTCYMCYVIAGILFVCLFFFFFLTKVVLFSPYKNPLRQD